MNKIGIDKLLSDAFLGACRLGGEYRSEAETATVKALKQEFMKRSAEAFDRANLYDTLRKQFSEMN